MAPTRPNTLRRRPLAVGPPLAAVGAAALMTDTGAAANADRRRAQPAGGPGRRLPGPPLLGVYLGNAPERVAPFEAWLGRRVDGVLGYTAGEIWEDIADPGWPLGLWGRIDRPVFWSVPLLPAGGRATLERAARGAYDRHWRACARRLAAFRPQDRHLHVRTGWEFNGDWFPWAAEGKEAAFASAFRRFADAFRAASPRFLLEWNCGLITDGADPERAWPGADWVDVVGMDFYWNRVCCMDQRAGAVHLPTRIVTRCGRTPGVPAPACGSMHGPRWRPRSSGVRPCASAVRPRSPACSG
jgi:hypothetical protein